MFKSEMNPKEVELEKLYAEEEKLIEENNTLLNEGFKIKEEERKASLTKNTSNKSNQFTEALAKISKQHQESKIEERLNAVRDKINKLKEELGQPITNSPRQRK